MYSTVKKIDLKILKAVSMLIVYCFWTFGSIVYSAYDFIKTRSNLSLLFLFLSFGIFGYIINVPYYVDMDLMRLYNAYDFLKDYSFIESIPYILSVGDFSYSLFWLLGHIGVPTQFLGFFAAAWFYGAWFLALLEIEKYFHKRFSPLAIVTICIIFLTVTHPFFFSGIRSSTGTMIALIGSIKLFFGNTKNGFILLMLSCFFHFSFLAYLAFCILYTFVKKRYVKLTFACLIIGSVLYMPLMNMVMGHIASFGIIGDVIANKIFAYTMSGNHESSAILTYGSGYRFIDNIVIFIFCTVFRFLPQYRRTIKKTKVLYDFDKFLTLFFGFCCFISPNSVMLGRYINILIYCNILFVGIAYFYCDKLFLSKFLLALAVISTFLSVIALYREMIGLDAIYYKYYPEVLYKGFASFLDLKIDYVK